MENEKKNIVTFLTQHVEIDKINEWKAEKISYLVVYLVTLF